MCLITSVKLVLTGNPVTISTFATSLFNNTTSCQVYTFLLSSAFAFCRLYPCPMLFLGFCTHTFARCSQFKYLSWQIWYGNYFCMLLSFFLKRYDIKFSIIRSVYFSQFVICIFTSQLASVWALLFPNIAFDFLYFVNNYVIFLP